VRGARCGEPSVRLSTPVGPAGRGDRTTIHPTPHHGAPHRPGPASSAPHRPGPAPSAPHQPTAHGVAAPASRAPGRPCRLPRTASPERPLGLRSAGWWVRPPIPTGCSLAWPGRARNALDRRARPPNPGATAVSASGGRSVALPGPGFGGSTHHGRPLSAADSPDRGSRHDIYPKAVGGATRLPRRGGRRGTAAGEHRGAPRAPGASHEHRGRPTNTGGVPRAPGRG
jgi:hypothetical protein